MLAQAQSLNVYILARYIYCIYSNGDFLAKKEDFEIKEDEDFEMVPLTPIRRLEKRLESIETTKTANGLEKFIDKVMDMVELNQKIIEDIVRSNQSMKEDMGILIGKLDTLQSKITGFIDVIQNAAESDVVEAAAESTGETIKPLIQKLEDIGNRSNETNAHILQSLENIEKVLRKPSQSPMQQTPQAATARDILARRAMMPPK